MNVGEGYEIVWDESAPKGRRIVKEGQTAKAEAPEVILNDGLGALSDESIRNEIEKFTGVRPHHRTGRAKLIAEWEAAHGINADD